MVSNGASSDRAGSDDTANVDLLDRGLGAGRAPGPFVGAAARKKRFLFF
jgi:hypothetical protein